MFPFPKKFMLLSFKLVSSKPNNTWENEASLIETLNFSDKFKDITNEVLDEYTFDSLSPTCTPEHLKVI